MVLVTFVAIACNAIKHVRSITGAIWKITKPWKLQHRFMLNPLVLRYWLSGKLVEHAPLKLVKFDSRYGAVYVACPASCSAIMSGRQSKMAAYHSVYNETSCGNSNSRYFCYTCYIVAFATRFQIKLIISSSGDYFIINPPIYSLSHTFTLFNRFLCRFYAIKMCCYTHHLPAIFILHFYDFSVACWSVFTHSYNVMESNLHVTRGSPLE